MAGPQGDLGRGLSGDLVYAAGALDLRLSLHIPPGATHVLLGESGAGKTTVLRLANRLLTESAGDILAQNRLAREWDVIALRRQMGYVVQDTAFTGRPKSDRSASSSSRGASSRT